MPSCGYEVSDAVTVGTEEETGSEVVSEADELTSDEDSWAVKELLK